MSQHAVASRAGAMVLEGGGNAVDAAVTTALSIGVLEPWLSGLGGGGFLITYEARTKSVRALDFSVKSPDHLDPTRYPLVDTDGGRGLFGWPAVFDDRNLYGFDSMCVPGSVDGFGRALELFGTIPWSRAMEPAVSFARDGLAVDWYTTLAIASSASELARHKPTRELFLPNGYPPVAGLGDEDAHLHFPELIATLEALSERGYRDFYEGRVAETLIRDLASGGSSIEATDLAGYHADVVEPSSIPFGRDNLHAIPGLSGGPSYLRAMRELDSTLKVGTAPDADTYRAFAQAIQNAYGHRLRTMGAGSADSCTTHVSAIDQEGNMAALTNTLLARFGSKIVLPHTGILMNNGVMWFDTVPDRPNSIRPGVRPLANMCPVIVTRDGEPIAALGAAGGRRIMPALAQITGFLLRFGMSPETACTTPRIDASSEKLILDERLPVDIADVLGEVFDTKTVRDDVYPPQFAVPSVAVRVGEQAVGVAHAQLPWPGAVSPGLGTRAARGADRARG